jgi:hypothetical protein
MTTTAPDPAATTTEDRLAILELTARLALLLDARDWPALERLFTDPVRWDRSSLFGGGPETQTPAELVGGLRYSLGGLDQTNHLIACQVIAIDGDQATGSANMQGTHVLANPSGDPVWTVGGRHDYEFKRTADGWRIAAVTFTVQWATGNMNILTLGMARAQS